MALKKNDVFTGAAVDYTFDGLGVVRHEGLCFFVKDLLKGESAEIGVTAVKKNVGYGRVIRRLSESPQRVEPRCPVARQCGGCQLQIMGAELQAEFKRHRVADCFQRIGHLDVEVQPVLSMEFPWNYRNKVQVPVGVNRDGKVISGYYRSHSHDIVDFDECGLHSEQENQILRSLRSWIEEAGDPAQLRHLLIKHAFKTGQVMVVLIAKSENLKGKDELLERLTAAYPQIRSIILNVNEREDNVILGDREIMLWGSASIEEELLGLRFQISAKSFYQINPVQTEVLYTKAIELAGLTGEETVIDVYCGTGTIGLSAARKAKRVIGIEIVPSAVEDAKRNAVRNGIVNAEFICGDAGVCTAQLLERRIQPDVAIVDPPRKGLDGATIDSLVRMNPERIVYVSCDPATLARDCAVLNERGYGVEVVQPVDMFPQTTHVETVVLLSHKKADSYIHIDVEFGEGEGKIPVDSIAKRAEAYKPKEKVTYKMIKEYIEAKYGFKVHTAYIAEVKRNLGLPMYDAPNAVEELKQPRKHPTPEKVEAIKDALRYFAVI